MILSDLVCHFHIGVDVTGSKGASVWHKKWEEYFFANLNGQESIAVNSALAVKELKKRLEQFKVLERVLDEEELVTNIGPALIWHLAWF